MRHLHVFALLAVAAPSRMVAQAAQARSPYAGQEKRVVKSMSDDELQGLREGRGVGLAAAAELNHYPGPRHALDLADSLALSQDQRAKILAIYDIMHDAVLPLGASLIAVESRIDSAFAARRMDESSLASLTRESARINGELRFAHLRAHLATIRVLTPEQVVSYDRLRGYGDGAGGHEGHRHPSMP
jgi:hypothetical protein